MFLKIQKFSDLEPYIKDKPEIHVYHRDDHTSVNYRVMNTDTFDNIGAIEARGIMFDDFGNIISRPLHKFHNLGVVYSEIDLLSQWGDIKAIYEKLDGSMISTCNFNGTVRLRSKSAFETHVAKLAYKVYNQNRDIQFLCQFCIERGLTATFELTHPEARIVLDYQKPELRLLHIRDNVTGEYVTDQISARLSVPMCPTLPVSELARILSKGHLEGLKGTEGYVVQLRNGDMVKIKCPWYLNLHRAVTFVRNRDIAKLVVENQLDDTLGAFKQAGMDVSNILRIERQVNTKLLEIYNEVERMYDTIPEGATRKDVAMAHKEHPYFSMLMQMFDGKEPQVHEYYRRNMLDKLWNLETVNTGGEL